MATAFFTPQTQSFDLSHQAVARVAGESASQPASHTNALEQFSLAPLTAGDIIDRAVRLYRRHFLVFLRIVLLPSLIAYAGSILWAIGVRNFSFERGDGRLLLTLALLGAGGVLWLVGKALFLMLLGGASRTLVWHFFDGTPLRAGDAFQAVRERWRSLLGAMVLVSLVLLIAVMMIYTVVSFALFFYLLLAVWLLSGLPQWVQGLTHFLFGGALLAGGALLLLLTYARVVCVPQAMMVEGISAFAAITRSFKLAGREFKRIAALVLFQFCVALSLYWLLMVPLGWYAYWNGVELGFFVVHRPLWFDIAQQTLAQVGEILIAPIVLLGFTLLYLDTRVRKEGFDVELLANRVLPPAQHVQTPAPPRVNEITWREAPAVNAAPMPIPPEGEFAEVVPLGAPVAEPPAAPVVPEQPVGLRFCVNCGTPAGPTRVFCSACGLRF